MDISVVPVTPFQQNCSVLRCSSTGAGAIVDPGGDLDRILEAIRALKATPEKIFLTHGHLDHAGGAAALARRLGVPVEGPHREDRFLLDALPRQGARYGFREVEACMPDRWLQEGEELRFGECRLEVIHCPGHTPGHIVFFNPSARFCLVGDVIFNGSVGRSDLPRGDHGTLVDSIRNKLFPLGDDITFFPGHGTTSTFGWERKCNPYVADLMFED